MSQIKPLPSTFVSYFPKLPFSHIFCFFIIIFQFSLPETKQLLKLLLIPSRYSQRYAKDVAVDGQKTHLPVVDSEEMHWEQGCFSQAKECKRPLEKTKNAPPLPGQTIWGPSHFTVKHRIGIEPLFPQREMQQSTGPQGQADKKNVRVTQARWLRVTPKPGLAGSSSTYPVRGSGSSVKRAPKYGTTVSAAGDRMRPCNVVD